jgi:NAD(P)-dependent dehydrogenase (short-subunit alcohol dehydrogenase family)
MSTDRPCALVTGAGRGLGRAIANRFREEGYIVVATDFDETLLSDLQDVDGYLTCQQDVSDPERAIEVAKLIESEVGRLDVIVNNAGINPFYPVCEAPPQRTIQGFMVNTFGALIVSQACLDLLIASRGRVVNIASESSPFRAPFQIYQSSKMALECLSDVMRRELMLFDVHVAIIRPGAIDTNLIEETRIVPIDVKESRFEPFFPRLREMITKRLPTRLSQPSDVAAVVYKAATDPKKKVMYRINNDPIQKLLPLLPAKLVDRAILKQLRS